MRVRKCSDYISITHCDDKETSRYGKKETEKKRAHVREVLCDLKCESIV